MVRYFGKNAHGYTFFDSDVHPPEEIPNDAIEITAEEHLAILQEHSKTGKAIVPGPDGKPVLVDPPPFVPSWQFYQGQARGRLEDSDIVVTRCYERGIAVPAAWIEYREALRAIVRADEGDPSKPLPEKPAKPEELG